jgi:hypothetical protein
MTFHNLLADTDCNCLEDALQDNITVFVRKINKPIVLDKDFKTHWERGKRAEMCKEICGFKGISINQWSEESQSAVIQKFLTTFRIAPKHKDSILVFRFVGESGLVKYTPNEADSTHYDFYKSDNFDLQTIDIQDITPLNTFLNHE